MLRKIKHLTAYFGGGRKLATIDAGGLGRLPAQSETRRGEPWEINREQAALRRMFVLGHRDRLVSSVPHFASFPSATAASASSSTPTSCACGAACPLDVRPILDLMYYTGWRLRGSDRASSCAQVA